MDNQKRRRVVKTLPSCFSSFSSNSSFSSGSSSSFSSSTSSFFSDSSVENPNLEVPQSPPKDTSPVLVRVNSDHEASEDPSLLPSESEKPFEPEEQEEVVTTIMLPRDLLVYITTFFISAMDFYSLCLVCPRHAHILTEAKTLKSYQERFYRQRVEIYATLEREVIVAASYLLPTGDLTGEKRTYCLPLAEVQTLFTELAKERYSKDRPSTVLPQHDNMGNRVMERVDYLLQRKIAYLQSKCNYHRNHKEGSEITFYSNGVTKSQCNYLKGEKEGEEMDYSLTGELQRKLMWTAGEQVDSHYPDGDIIIYPDRDTTSTESAEAPEEKC